MRRIAVVFGGRSGEHEVSLMSAQSVLSALDPARYEAIQVGIGRDGRWWTGDQCLDLLQRGEEEQAERATLLPDPTGPVLHTWRNDGSFQPLPIDAVFPVLHGPYGEDGTIQGLLEMAGIPYVGCAVGAAAVGMDKVLMKAVFGSVGLPQVDYRAVNAARWRASPDAVLQEIEDLIGFPCFVKPASLGSSVGVYRAVSRESLRQAMERAAALDHKVVIEREATGFREVEVGVLGNADPQVSVPGEITPVAGYYDYEAKYADERTQLTIPAQVSEQTAQRLAAMGRQAFLAIGGTGLARVDFFVSPDERQIFVNEINTMPGFTRVSMFPKVWMASGLSYEQLVDRLIDLAFERHSEQSRVAQAQAEWRPGTAQEQERSTAPANSNGGIAPSAG